MTLRASMVEHGIRIGIAGGLFLTAVLLWEYFLQPTPRGSGSAQTEHEIVRVQAEGRVRRGASADLDPTLHLEALTFAETSTYEGPGRNLFEPILPSPTVAGLTDHEFTFSNLVQTVAPFSSGLRFYGFSSSANSRRIFLLKGEDVFIAQEGDTIDRRYRVLRVTRDSVEIEDVLAGAREWIYLPRL